MTKKIQSHPVPLNSTGISDDYLVLCETPSTRFWEVAHYDLHFTLCPWRTTHNHPVSGKVIEFRALPTRESGNVRS